MSSSSLSTVQALKRSLSKHVSAWSGSSSGSGGSGGVDMIYNEDNGDGAEDTTTAAPHDDEAMSDLLDRLDECEMTLDVLTETLVGTVVSKLKTHPSLGGKAKALIKKWKAVAKKGDTGTHHSRAASAAAATKSAGAAPSGGAAPKPTTSVASSSAPKKRNSSVVAAPPLASRLLSRRESAASTGSVDPHQNDNDNDDDVASYWSDLPEQRQNVCRKLHSVLLEAASSRLLAQQEGGDGTSGGRIHADALPHLVGQRTAEIEDAIYASFSGSAKSYADKARSLAFNLKKNADLSASVVLGDAGMTASDLVSMTSEQLASDALRTARAQEAQKVIDSKRLDWEQANEDKINEMCGIKGDLLKASLFTCSRCKSTKTTSTQKQTRSADEPMTVFVLCINCGKRWKC